MARRSLRSPVPGTCAHCGARFVGIAGRRYCSARCKSLAFGKRGRAQRRAARIGAGLPLNGSTPGICIVCGTPFIGHRDKRFCSRKCELFFKARTPEERERQRRKQRLERQMHPERVRERARRGRKRAAEYRQTWRRRDRDKVRAASARYRERDRDHYRELQRKHYWKARDKRLAATRAWRRANPEKRAHVQAARRAREIGAPGSHTHAQWLALCAAWDRGCAYCGAGDVVLTRDHVVPLKRGGSNDISNILPACKPCNCKKGQLTADEFRARMMRLKAG